MSERIDWDKPIEIVSSGSVHSCEVLHIVSWSDGKDAVIRDVEDGDILIAHKNGEVDHLNFIVRNVQEKRLVPFTRETFPWPSKDVLVREKCGHRISAVVFTSDTEVGFGNSTRIYEALWAYYEISLDRGQTWQPAGVEVTE